MDDLDFVVSPKLALLDRLREHLADLHELRAEDRYHSAIAECPCDVARDYRALKAWIYAQRAGRHVTPDEEPSGQH